MTCSYIVVSTDYCSKFSRHGTPKLIKHYPHYTWQVTGDKCSFKANTASCELTTLVVRKPYFFDKKITNKRDSTKKKKLHLIKKLKSLFQSLMIRSK